VDAVVGPAVGSEVDVAVGHNGCGHMSLSLTKSEYDVDGNLLPANPMTWTKSKIKPVVLFFRIFKYSETGV
jgi:hypothetical protein